MNTSMNRSLAKVLGSALLLTATLALPVESFGAPSPDPKAAAMDKDDKRNKQQQRNVNKGQRQDRRQVQAQRQENRRQVKQQVQKSPRQETRRQAAQLQAQRKAEQQAQWQRQEARRQAQLRAQQQTQLQRQQDRNRQLQLQRQAEWRRQEEARRVAEQRRNNRYYSGDRSARDRRWYNNQYDRYYRSGERFHIDGFVVEEGGYCSLLRDHQGHVFALVGSIGDIVQGDHLRLQGRVVGGEACDWRGTAFEVIQVKTLWDNNRHESASYDYQRDRYSFEEFLDSRY
jgi:hypothetical protein